MPSSTRWSLLWAVLGLVFVVAGWSNADTEHFCTGIFLLAISWRKAGGRVFHLPLATADPELLNLLQTPPALPMPHKSPIGACVMSFVVPGSGQLYCRKLRRAFWTMGVFLLLCLGASLTFASDSSDTGWSTLSVLLWWPSLVLHVFAVVDAYATARESNNGLGSYIIESPRVAAALNLITGWIGYSYLGERKKAFTMLGITWFLGATGLPLLLFPIVSADAYVTANRAVKDNIAALPPYSDDWRHRSWTSMTLVGCLSVVVVLIYLGLLVLLVSPNAGYAVAAR